MAKNTIKHVVRRIVSALPGGKALIQKCENFLAKRRLARIGGAREVFSHYYNNNYWRNEESVSGPGSTIQNTANIRKIIPCIIHELGVVVILDAPCGDYNWFRMIEWQTEIKYIGGDIVQPLVDRNQELYSDDQTIFINLDIVQNKLPDADLWLCRDCFCHLSNSDVMLAINNFLQSNIRYLLTSTYLHSIKNNDIATGLFRLINLELPPFSFDKPIRVIDDSDSGQPDKHLALWDRETIRNSLVFNELFQKTCQHQKGIFSN